VLESQSTKQIHLYRPAELLKGKVRLSYVGRKTVPQPDRRDVCRYVE